MNRDNHSLQSGTSGSASRCPAGLIAILITSFLAFSIAGCHKKEEKPAEKQALVVNGNFPVAEPALSNAVIKGEIAEIQKILDSGADLNTKDALDRTPLHIAAFYGRIKIVELLVAKGADVNAKDHTGMTPLHAAVISGGRQTVQLLLEKQADMNAKNGAGQTPLHLAAATGQPKLTKYLIERGADPQKKDFDGKTPLYYAKKNYHPQTTTVIEQILAKKASLPPATQQSPQ